MALKHSLDKLPGEIQYREHLNNYNFQIEYRKYQEWRMGKGGRPLGISMDDIDVFVSDDQWETFQSMRDIEYQNDKDYALLEMKHFAVQDSVISRIVTQSSPNKRLANNSKLPFYVVKYYPASECDYWEFKVYPANDYAKAQMPEPKHLSEQEYLKFLFETLRGQSVPNDILTKASTQKTQIL